MHEGSCVEVSPGEMTAFVEELVASGRYPSASDVVEDALRALRDALQDNDSCVETPEAIAWMRAKVRESLDDPSPDVPAKTVSEELERRYREDVRTDRSAA